MKPVIIWSLFGLLLLPACGSAFGQTKGERKASEVADAALFRKSLETWVQAFNTKDLDGTMTVWSEDAILSSPGSPDGNYQRLREGYKRGFARADISGTYSVEIEEVQVSGKMAFVRDTWILTLKEKDPAKPVRSVKQRSIEIWQQQPDRTWKIVRSLSYPDPAPDK